MRALAVALVFCCCGAIAGTALALSGRGGGYQSERHHQRASVSAQIRRLNELLGLSAAQKQQLSVILLRSAPAATPTKAQIRALLTERQRAIYDRSTVR